MVSEGQRALASASVGNWFAGSGAVWLDGTGLVLVAVGAGLMGLIGGAASVGAGSTGAGAAVRAGSIEAGLAVGAGAGGAAGADGAAVV
jgi:hypothetical protein